MPRQVSTFQLIDTHLDPSLQLLAESFVSLVVRAPATWQLLQPAFNAVGIRLRNVDIDQAHHGTKRTCT